MKLYLGMVGAAKTSYAAVCDSSGEIIKVIKAPPLTIRVNENLKYFLKITLEELCNQAEIDFNHFITNLEGCCIAMSGVYFDSDVTALKKLLEQIGFWGNFNFVICEDVFAHIAANIIPFGGVVIAGTGSNVFLNTGFSSKPIRVDGWGSDLGDDGSGYFLGRSCLRMIFQGYDKRIKRSPLLEKAVLEYLDLSKIEDLVQWFYSSRKTIYWRSALSDLSIPLIHAAEIENDELSLSILNDGVEALLKSLVVALNLAKKQFTKYTNEPFQIILEGGLFENSRTYKESFQKKIDEFSRKGFNCAASNPKYLPIIGSLAISISKNTSIDNTLLEVKNLQKSASSHNLKVKANF